jgi:hypothetical protein
MISQDCTFSADLRFHVNLTFLDPKRELRVMAYDSFSITIFLSNDLKLLVMNGYGKRCLLNSSLFLKGHYKLRLVVLLHYLPYHFFLFKRYILKRTLSRCFIDYFLQKKLKCCIDYLHFRFFMNSFIFYKCS